MKNILLFLLFPLALSAQQSINGKAFFTQNITTIGLSEDIQLELPNFPWFDKYEIRTETREFDFSQQEYTLRLTPSTPAKFKAQKEIFRHLNQQSNFELEKFKCDINLELHEDWKNLYFLNREKTLRENYSKWLTKESEHLTSLIESKEFNTRDLVKIRIRQNDHQLKLDELQSQQEELLSYYDLELYKMDFSDFPGIGELMILVKTLQLQIQVFDDREIDYELEMNNREMQLEKAEKKQIFDFLQMRYRGPHSDLLEERISLGLGIILPTSGNRMLKMKELEIEKEKLLLERQINHEKQSQRIKRSITEISKTFENYQNNKEIMSLEKEQLSLIETKILENENADLATVFEIRQRFFENQLDLLDQEEKLVEDILSLLEISELICVRNKQFYFTKQE